MINKLKQELFKNQDLKFKEFHSKLCPNTNNIIGIRLPVLRKITKEILKQDYLYFLNNVDNEYYEETMLEGLVITESKMILDDKIKYLDKFIPKIDNWAICDTVCANLKLKNNELEKFWNYIIKYKNSKNEFELRFMIVIMMDYYLEKNYLKEVFKIIDNIKVDYYYTNMAISWLIASSYVKQKEETIKYLKSNKLSKFTYNKAIGKMIDSKLVSKEEKESLRKLKR